VCVFVALGIQQRTEYLYGQVYMFTQGSPKLNPKIQHTRTRSAAARRRRRLCYHPAIFFLHIRLINARFKMLLLQSSPF